MPELPEAESFRRYLDSYVIHKRVSGAEIFNELILGNVSADKLISTLKGSCITGTHRHGKYVGAELHPYGILILHFGMSGTVRFYREEDRVPDHTTMRIDFDDGGHLAFTCIRVLCRTFLAENMSSFVRWKRLGPDALDGLSRNVFEELLSRRTGRIKAILLDQHFIAGIGNIYADEILFQAGLHPLRNADSLSSEERELLFRKIGIVLRKAVDLGSDWSRFPDDFLVSQRGLGGNCPSCGVILGKVRVGGRTSYFCPRCQSRGR